MKRIQRTRKKGAKLPPNTLVVTRGTPFGNQFVIKRQHGCFWISHPKGGVYKFYQEKDARESAVLLYKENLTPELKQEFIHICITKSIDNIACFCPTNKPCHGDVWLQVWEEYQKQIGKSDD